MGEAGSFSGEGPKEIDHAAGKTANCGERDLSACADFGALENFLIRFLERALGCEDENALAINALLKEMAHPLHADGGLAAAGGPREEDA